MAEIRLETKPFGRTELIETTQVEPSKRGYTPPDPEKLELVGWAGNKMKHEPLPVLIPEKGFIKCPHCQNGVAKQVMDGKDLVWGCIMCGWEKPTREPDRKRYGEEKIEYGKRY